ncbi:hypothetical protein [Methylorubrum thiocyanatum]|uniref:Uncharacterized protein n=1 Tax=Methylorubrum thiocyanatum TaxID=47958 RepID=A0AA40S2G2_9HYPH|nr:hypothetical protein [Methylorubrum thiocyanatum]MBA8913204.1 hypothetical protein [Methylorubrum thiocyanatum]
MDVGELRAAFLATEGLHQSIRRFRNERLGIIDADDSVVSMWPGPKVILHVVSLEAFTSDRRIEITKPNDILLPLGADDYANARWTLEGLASLPSGGDEQTSVEDYAMLFRTGAIEAVSSLGRRMEGSNRLPLPSVERDLISSLRVYRAKLAEKDISMPLYVFVTLIGVRGNYPWVWRTTGLKDSALRSLKLSSCRRW